MRIATQSSWLGSRASMAAAVLGLGQTVNSRRGCNRVQFGIAAGIPSPSAEIVTILNNLISARQKNAIACEWDTELKLWMIVHNLDLRAGEWKTIDFGTVADELMLRTSFGVCGRMPGILIIYPCTTTTEEILQYGNECEEYKGESNVRDSHSEERSASAGESAAYSVPDGRDDSGEVQQDHERDRAEHG